MLATNVWHYMVVKILNLWKQRLDTKFDAKIATVFSLEQECFQGALESWRGMHQLEFCCQPVACLRGSHFIRLSLVLSPDCTVVAKY